MKKYELESNDENLKKTIIDNTLNRNEKIINLMKLINNIKENYIISIDGNWGTGKTFFVKQLMYINRNFNEINISIINEQKQIIEEFSNNYFIVYYNAWENDDHKKPVESLIYNILNEYPKYKNDIQNPEELFTIAKDMLINFIEKSSFGIITKGSLEKLTSFDQLAESIHTIEEKKSALNELLKLLTQDKRILLIIDELDRCKPDYAVKVLETIKHFYNNDNITTLVVTNNNQLSSTIRHFYGYDFDGYGYLNKIYDTVITLKTERIDEYTKFYCNIMLTTHLPENVSNLLFHYFNFSYRECNKYMSMYRIIEPYIEYEGFQKDEYLVESSIFLPIAIAMKIKNIDLYNDFINGNAESFFNDFFNRTKMDKINKEYYPWFYEIFGANKNDDLINCALKKYNSVFNQKPVYRSFPYMEAISMLGNMIDFNK